jgi:regulator of cell morphogenesis and NO signaling
MINNLIFNEVKEKYFKRLEQYVPLVARVHGKHHPEFYEVEKVFNEIKEKLNQTDFDLTSEFKKLREITTNYEVPGDVCETYAAVYGMLEELDKTYFE